MKTFSVLLSVLMLSYLQAQDVNAILFIDGKIPNKELVKIEFIDSSSQVVASPLYTVGSLSFKKSEWLGFEKFNSSLFTVKISYSTGAHTYVYTQKYRGSFFIMQEYVVLRITNLKKGEYYFGISIPGVSSEYIKKEYYPFLD